MAILPCRLLIIFPSSLGISNPIFVTTIRRHATWRRIENEERTVQRHAPVQASVTIRTERTEPTTTDTDENVYDPCIHESQCPVQPFSPPRRQTRCTESMSDTRPVSQRPLVSRSIGCLEGCFLSTNRGQRSLSAAQCDQRLCPSQGHRRVWCRR